MAGRAALLSSCNYYSNGINNFMGVIAVTKNEMTYIISFIYEGDGDDVKIFSEEYYKVLDSVTFY